MPRFGAIAVVVGMLMVTGGDSALVAATLPKPTGPFAVGRRVLRWIDTSRPEVSRRRRQTGSYRVIVADAVHDSFSDIEVLTKDSPRHRELLVMVRDDVRAFFDRTLKGEGVTALDRDAVDALVRIQPFDPR